MMEKRVAIITGGSSGLGLAIARKFTEQGIVTYIVGRDSKKLENVSVELGQNCRPIAFDLTQLARIPELVKDILAQESKIDILVNNAGINLKKDFIEVTDDEFEKIIRTNLSSVFSITREVAKSMISRNHGAVVNISSMAAHYGIPKVSAYTASKSAIEGITHALAVELSPLGIRVNCVAPGFISTQMSYQALNGDPQRKNRVITRTPLGKMGDPEDVANAVYFLATNDSSFITGSVVKVDGGNSIGF
jgi:NAD(P)-dependent dehydrogenase (short-subunit alcohol dehydrogenase family)